MLTAPNTDMAEDCWLALDADGTVVGWALSRTTRPAGDRDFIEVYAWPGRGVPVLRPLLDLLLARAAVRGARFGHDPYQVRAGAIPNETAWIATLDRRRLPVRQDARPHDALPGGRADRRAGTAAGHHRAAAEPPATRPRCAASTPPSRRPSRTPITRPPTSDLFRGGRRGDHGGLGRVAGRRGARRVGRRAAFVRHRRRRQRRLGQGARRAAARTAARGWARRSCAAPSRSTPAKGRTEAGLGVDMENPTAAVRLYRAVGMHPLYEANIYQREVRASDLRR